MTNDVMTNDVMTNDVMTNDLMTNDLMTHHPPFPNTTAPLHPPNPDADFKQIFSGLISASAHTLTGRLTPRVSKPRVGNTVFFAQRLDGQHRFNQSGGAQGMAEIAF
jgi:hypothetical protein